MNGSICDGGRNPGILEVKMGVGVGLDGVEYVYLLPFPRSRKSQCEFIVINREFPYSFLQCILDMIGPLTGRGLPYSDLLLREYIYKYTKAHCCFPQSINYKSTFLLVNSPGP